jgi:hypothetical protein
MSRRDRLLSDNRSRNATRRPPDRGIRPSMGIWCPSKSCVAISTWKVQGEPPISGKF